MQFVTAGRFALVAIGAICFAAPATVAMAQSQCSFNVSVPDGVAPVGQLVSSSGQVWMSNIGSGPAPGTLFDFADARIALNSGASATIRVMGQDIVLQPESLVKLVQQGSSICVEINAYMGSPNLQPDLAIVETPQIPLEVVQPVVAPPSIPPVTIPLVIGAGVGAAVLLGDDGDGSSSN
ncbi:MAG TPA: hypothetical protein VLQ68_01950 [Rhizobiaceae bacterium]|nr:hypothetical protein [Rhizobiaceae bacterium]